MFNIKKYLSALLLLASSYVVAQQSHSIPAEINHFTQGTESFKNKQYAAAVYHFNTYLEDVAEQSDYSSRELEAEYYLLFSNHYLNKDGVIEEMNDFVKSNNGTYLANQMVYELACYYFEQEKYKKALDYFEDCEEKSLQSPQIPGLYYKTAYSQFSQKKYKEAKPMFKSTLDLNSDYYYDALYYYSFLQYKDENYNSALTGFETLEEKGLFESTVPYYIAQIYFMKRDYEKFVSIAPALLEDEYTENDLELNRIIGDAYYNIKDYDNAIKYLVASQAGATKILRQDSYHLGMAYYMKKDYAKAVEVLSQILPQNDEITQSAYSCLGECFVKLDNKERACMAFATSAKYNFNPEVREDAYYNYVKLSYETAVTPFHGTILLFEEFLEEFPESNYTQEIYDIMYKAYTTTTNYKDACVSIEELKHKDTRLAMAYQRVMYYRGVELYNDGKYKEAVNHFAKSLTSTTAEKQMKGRATYWLADAYYQLEDYNNALVNYDLFIKSIGAYTLDEYPIAHYNYGYCLFKSHKYDDAIVWFRKFTQLNSVQDKNWSTDAYNRIGDCLFLKRSFYEAIKYYNQAIEIGGDGIDYAYYQKGFCQGMCGQDNPKIATLNALINSFPTSPYADDALYEMGAAWVTLKKYDEAVDCYLQLPISYPNSKYAAKSLLNAGLTYYNNNQLIEASNSYKKVVDVYPGTDESKAALLALKNISIEQNSVQEYITYTKEKGVDNIQEQEQDSLTFTAAERMYINQQFMESVSAFDAYIHKFTNGKYVLVAYFYMADAYLQMSQQDEAVRCLEYIANQPRNIYSEQSLSVLSTIYFENKYYKKALETYQKLLVNAEQKENIVNAKKGIVECNYQLEEAGATILAVEELIKENISLVEMNKSLYYKGKSYMRLENENAAMESFTELSQYYDNVYGAEANYILANMHFENDSLALAKEQIFSFINKGSSHQYWLAKSFILLSDIFVAEGDLFLAKQYLLSVNDNYKLEDDILGIVSNKIDVIIQKEEAENQMKRDSLDMHFIVPTDSVK